MLSSCSIVPRIICATMRPRRSGPSTSSYQSVFKAGPSGRFSRCLTARRFCIAFGRFSLACVASTSTRNEKAPHDAVNANREEEWLTCPETLQQLRRLGDVLKQAVEVHDLQLKVMALHLISSGGKRIWPAPLFFSASSGQDAHVQALRAAPALALMHAASLC